MTSNQEHFDPQVVKNLQALRSVPPRNEHKAAAGRASFLAEARQLAKQQSSKPIVTPSLRRRLKEWFEQVSNPIRRKERFSMVTVLTSLVVVFSLLFGGAGATVYAAQDSMPNDALYGVKLLSEDVSLTLAGSAEEKIDLLIEYADRRNEEILALARENAEKNAGAVTPLGPIANKYAEQVMHALELASTLPDSELTVAVAEIGVHIRKHDRDRVSWEFEEFPGAAEDPLLTRLLAVRRLQIGLTELGMVDPVGFKYQLRAAQDQLESGVLLDTTEPAEVPTGDGVCDPNDPADPDCADGICDPLNPADPDCVVPEAPYGHQTPNEGEVPSYGPFGPFGNQNGEGESYGPGEQNEGEVTQPVDPYGPSYGAGPDNGGEQQQPSDGYGKTKPVKTVEPSSGGQSTHP